MTRERQDIDTLEDMEIAAQRIVRWTGPGFLVDDLREPATSWSALEQVALHQERFGQTTRDDGRLSAIEARLTGIEESLLELSSRVGEGPAPRTYSTWLTKLRTLELRLRRDVPVVVTEDDDEVSISWDEAAITGLGESWYDAVESFESQLVEQYEHLVETDETVSGANQLGPLPLHWRSLLVETLERPA